jgi:hypothetical protein
MMGYYPKIMRKTTHAKTPARTDYTSDIYMWMVTSVFRQWFAQSLCEGGGRAARDGGARLYREIGDGVGGAYLGREVMEAFHQLFPMSGKGKGCLATAVRQFKAEIKDYVAPLLVNHSQAQLPSRDYLTCTEVLTDDLPWVVQAGDAEMWDQENIDAEWEAYIGQPAELAGDDEDDGDSESDNDENDDSDDEIDDQDCI